MRLVIHVKNNSCIKNGVCSSDISIERMLRESTISPLETYIAHSVRWHTSTIGYRFDMPWRRPDYVMSKQFQMLSWRKDITNHALRMSHRADGSVEKWKVGRHTHTATQTERRTETQPYTDKQKKHTLIHTQTDRHTKRQRQWVMPRFMPRFMRKIMKYTCHFLILVWHLRVKCTAHRPTHRRTHIRIHIFL